MHFRVTAVQQAPVPGHAACAFPPHVPVDRWSPHVHAGHGNVPPEQTKLAVRCVGPTQPFEPPIPCQYKTVNTTVPTGFHGPSTSDEGQSTFHTPSQQQQLHPPIEAQGFVSSPQLLDCAKAAGMSNTLRFAHATNVKKRRSEFLEGCLTWNLHSTTH